MSRFRQNTIEAVLFRAAPLVLFLTSTAVAPLGCNDSCEENVAIATDLRSRAAKCSDDTCVLVNGIDGDCTGQFSCTFAVRADAQRDVEEKARELAEDSSDCNLCAQAFCAQAVAAECDASLGECVVVTPQ